MAGRQWLDKPYHSLNFHIQEAFGEKLYKLSLNGGMTCPNRDGRLGRQGCIFCSEGGSGDFSESPSLSVADQIEKGKERLRAKHRDGRYIAYFQAYTNTYAPVSYLRPLFEEAIRHPDIAALSIATRPDCLGPDVLALLSELNRIKPVWVELGLQTIHEKSAVLIRRGYPLSCFDKAVSDLAGLHIACIVHMILGLPGETPEDMLATASYISRLPIQGLKLQLLHILKHTDLELLYNKTNFPIFTLEEYSNIIVQIIERLPPGLVIHRITGDGPKALLIEPKWSGNKKHVLNTIHHTFKSRGTWQGRLYSEPI